MPQRGDLEQARGRSCLAQLNCFCRDHESICLAHLLYTTTHRQTSPSQASGRKSGHLPLRGPSSGAGLRPCGLPAACSKRACVGASPASPSPRQRPSQPAHSCTPCLGCRCAAPFVDCACRGLGCVSGNCTTGIYVGHRGTDSKGAAMETAYQIQQLNQFSVTNWLQKVRSTNASCYLCSTQQGGELGPPHTHGSV
jgi:hypothetical protein